MPVFEAKVKFTDVRVITIEAASLEEAEEKYAGGEWESEDTVDFYTEAELKPLREVES